MTRCQAWTEGEQAVAANGYGVSFWSDETFLELDSGEGCTTLGLE